jgi:predicted transcriptional regulator
MAIISLRLPDDIDRQLGREAEATQRPKSEIARDAIAAYLSRQQRDRFLAEIARAARARSGEDPVAVATESVALDNEAQALADGPRRLRTNRRRPRLRPS